MKRQFGLGVPTSAFIAYLNRLIAKFQLTDGVETGLQQSSGNSILMSNTQILYGLPREQIWTTLRELTDKAKRQFGIDNTRILKAIQDNINILPTFEEQTAILDKLPDELRAEVIEIRNRMFNNVASNNEIADLIQEISTGLANRDRVYTEKEINGGVALLSLDESVLEDKAELVSLLNQYFRTGSQNEVRAIESGSNDLPAMDFEPLPDLEDIEEFNPEDTPEVKSIFPSKPSFPTLSSKEASDRVPRNYTAVEWEQLGKSNKTKKAEFLRKRLQLNPTYIFHSINGKEYGMDAFTTIKGAESGKGAKGQRLPFSDIANADLDAMFDEYLELSKRGTEGQGFKGKMCGKGLALKEQKVLKPKIEKPYRQSIAHLMDKPMEKPKPYTQFGRYFINKPRLEGEGIVAFRQPSGNTIPNLPTEKLSKPLSKVVRTLVGKGLPSYEDIADLSREDKIKLNHICKTCKVDSPAIPKMKGEGEQEDDRFNILRGEIIAGNDNAKIAKEFKVMLMKFMNEGRIPRRQANEILQELLALGH